MNNEVFNSQKEQKQKKYKLTIIILCFLLTITGFSTIFLASNSLTTNSIQTNKVSNISVNDVKKATEFLNELLTYIKTLNKNENLDVLKVDIAYKIYELSNNSYDSVAVDAIASELLSNLSGTFADSQSLIDGLGTNIGQVIKDVATKLESLMLNYDERIQIESTTAAQTSEAGPAYKVNLNAYIYYAPTKSTKWAVIVHPFMTNGKIYAQAIAKMYLEQGYNVIAPDLRGFGKSGGSVGMGYLESLDIWDWLTYINDENNYAIADRKASKVIIHGTSLGGATTLQTWTQANMGRDLTTKNVIGIVDDCGYDSMTGIIEGLLTTGSGMELLAKITNLVGKENLYDLIGEENIKNYLINQIKVGLKEEDFDLKQNAFHPNRQISKVPLYIIHGTSDTTVPYSISTSIVYPAAKKANLLYDFWQVQGQQHAFIIVGLNKTEYTNNISKYIRYLENQNTSNKEEQASEDITNLDDQKDLETNEEEKEEKGFFAKIGDAIVNFFKSIGNFFKNLFN